MCLSVKDQNEDLREWLLHHHGIGAGKFYIMDDNSIEPVAEMLIDLIEDGVPSSRYSQAMPESSILAYFWQAETS